jgi:hypothetical protein
MIGPLHLEVSGIAELRSSERMMPMDQISHRINLVVSSQTRISSAKKMIIYRQEASPESE